MNTKIGHDYMEIAAEFPRAYTNRDGELLLVENSHGYAIVINRKFEGYQAHAKIKPNTRTGSSVGLTGDYWDTVEKHSLVKIARDYRGGISRQIYNEADIPTIKFLTIEQAVTEHDNILGYTLLNRCNVQAQ